MSNAQDILGECAVLAGKAFPNSKQAVQRDTALYLAHTDRGQSIRALAGVTGTHPSTVLRTVRRIEDRRDDPLLDSVLTGLERGLDARPVCRPLPAPEAKSAGGASSAAPGADAGEDAVRRQAKRYLRRLSEPGSMLVIAEGAEKGGVFCAANQHRKPIAMLPVTLAAEFLRRDWIAVSTRGTSTIRYRITDVGRAFLKRALAADAEARRAPAGLAPRDPLTRDPFAAQHALAGTRAIVDRVTGKAEQLAVNLGESPLGWLARRKGADGRPFLEPDEVEAGERLRNDWETAQMGPSVAQDWRKFLTPGDRLSGTPVARGPGEGPAASRERASAALAVLGPGLSDVAIRVCCFLEGLEACERRMGWSARSGKVVLKIALQRLSQHYGLAPFRDGGSRGG